MSMLLSELILDTAIAVKDSTIEKIVIDSREAGPGALMICLPGAARDGHDFAKDAYDRGCRTFLVMRRLALPEDAVQAEAADTKAALPVLAARFFGHPAEGMHLVGITGTKGKTSCAWMLYSILKAQGLPAAYIGTIGTYFQDRKYPSANTTPDALVLNGTLAEMRACGISHVVLELSSQSVPEHRIDGLHTDFTVLTNLYPDHIGPGEHPSLEAYFGCKKKILEMTRPDLVVYNRDQAEIRELIAALPDTLRTVSFGLTEGADITAADLSARRDGNLFTQSFRCGQTPLSLPMPGEYNVLNALPAILIARKYGADEQVIKSALATLQIPGRMEFIPLSGNRTAVIDYAHNGASLRAALETLRPLTAGKLFCLFGSVGGRTEIRRSELGQAAASLADRLYLTSDNPDREDPTGICREIFAAAKRTNPRIAALIEPDRAAAIREAVGALAPGDILLLAGKGHEDYQLVDGRHIPFDEHAILAEFK